MLLSLSLWLERKSCVCCLTNAVLSITAGSAPSTLAMARCNNPHSRATTHTRNTDHCVRFMSDSWPVSVHLVESWGLY
jgi:hypothetical protein